MATVTKQLGGKQDLLLGAGTVEQTRGGITVTLDKLNAGNIPFSGDEETEDFLSIKERIENTGLLIIDDGTVATASTYSSSKIESELSSRDSSIDSLISSVLALQTSTAQGQLGGTANTVLTTSEVVLPFTAITQSTNTSKFSIGTNTITIEEAGTYNFISTVTFEDSGADGDVGIVTFNLRDTTDDTLYYTQASSVEISGFDRDTIPFNSLMVVSDTLAFPITIDINVSCSVAGYTINEFSSILSLQGGSVQTIETIDLALGAIYEGL